MRNLCCVPPKNLRLVTDEVTVRAPAKVNLHLGVGPLRADGYHELTTVFCALSLHDDVTVSPAPELTLTVEGESAREVPTDRRNLAAKAALLLAERAGVEPAVRIHIDKQIPVAGGMAGGSADAAATLLALNILWQLDRDREELFELGAQLGSDVPFALHGGVALGSGRGEKLLPVLARDRLHWVLALSRDGLSTPAVYGELDRLRDARETRGERAPAMHIDPPDDLMVALVAGDPNRVAPLLVNDLQPAAVSLQPTLRRTLRAGRDAGALAGMVSGSGPTCAFLCADEADAVAVAAELSGSGVARAVRMATGPVPGARVVGVGE